MKLNENCLIGLTVGTFDLCHAGHVLMFKEAKTVCDYLIVGLQSDASGTDPSYRGKPKDPPIMSVKERLIILKAIRYVDEIFTYTSEEELYEILKTRDYDVRIIGADWKGKNFTGWNLPKKVYYNSRKHGYSTTELKERIRSSKH